MADNKLKRFEGFKKFSDMKNGGNRPKVEEVDPSDVQPSELELPGNPNLPSKKGKIEKPMSRKGLMPEPEKEFNSPIRDEEEPIDEKNVKMYGKVAKFPKKVKASKAYNFLENVKISKNSIWYLLVEKDNELQVVKYNNKKGVDMTQFVNELKTYYLNHYKGNRSICEMINRIEVDGKKEFSSIRNIPNVDIEGKKIISKITEDLIRLLSK